MNRIMLRRPSPSMAVALAALVVAATGAAVAAIPNPDGSVAVCYTSSSGNLVGVIDTGAGERCSRKETQLSLATVSGGKVANSDKLDGQDSTAFLSSTSAAGGDLTGNYPNPDIAGNAVSASEVANGSLGTGEFSSSIPAAKVTNSADQAVSDSGNLALAFSTEHYDTASMHDTATDNTRLTAPVTGIYAINAGVVWANGGTGTRSIALRKNGTETLTSDTVFHDHTTIQRGATVTTMTRLEAGDYVEAVAHQSSGASLNVMAVSGSPDFSMTWLAPGP